MYEDAVKPCEFIELLKEIEDNLMIVNDSLLIITGIMEKLL